MSQTESSAAQPTAVDDVRAVREKIAREHGGDLKQHIQETNRIGDALREKLNLRIATNGPEVR